MSDDAVYRRLQEDLDRMPVGFPATESGVEIRILRQLFTPAEARVALCVNMKTEPVATIRRRLDFEMSGEMLALTLEGMVRRGLIRKDDSHAELRYGKLPFVIGIYEGQVDKLSKQLAFDLMEYFEDGLGQAIRPRKTTQLRTVPIHQPIPVEHGVGQYDDVRASVRKCEGPFAVMNCICRQAQDLAGKPCRQTAVRENCLTMGSAAKVMVSHGQARYITRERMLELLDGADREGLVLQPQNTRDPLFVCLCCGCCCVSLRAGKRLDRPVEFFAANFYVRIHTDECRACGECVHRCQMDAMSLDGGAAGVDLSRCIGCGLCVSTCPAGAIELRAKPEGYTPPASVMSLYSRIYRERYGNLAFAKTGVRLLTRQLA